MKQRKLWIALILVIVASFSVLIYYGKEIYQQAPPIPERVVDEVGNTLFTSTDITDGQECVAEHRRTRGGNCLGAWCLCGS